MINANFLLNAKIILKLFISSNAKKYKTLMIKIILLRHGQSQWNLENGFTGWKDVSLTKEGENEAKFAAEQINNLNLNISSIYASILNRNL